MTTSFQWVNTLQHGKLQSENSFTSMLHNVTQLSQNHTKAQVVFKRFLEQKFVVHCLFSCRKTRYGIIFDETYWVNIWVRGMSTVWEFFLKKNLWKFLAWFQKTFFEILGPLCLENRCLVWSCKLTFNSFSWSWMRNHLYDKWCCILVFLDKQKFAQTEELREFLRFSLICI